MKRKMHDGDEQDALTRSGKNSHNWDAGERKAQKRKANKRDRKAAKQQKGDD